MIVAIIGICFIYKEGRKTGQESKKLMHANDIYTVQTQEEDRTNSAVCDPTTPKTVRSFMTVAVSLIEPC